MIWWSLVQVRWSTKILWVYFLCWCSLIQNGEFERSEMVELDVLRCWDDKLGMIKWWISCSVKLNVEQPSEFSALLNLFFDWAIHWNSLFCLTQYLHMLANSGVLRTAVWGCSNLPFLGSGLQCVPMLTKVFFTTESCFSYIPLLGSTHNPWHVFIPVVCDAYYSFFLPT